MTSRLLLDPASVARLAGEDTDLRAANHKVQVLLRAEVHWLLASQVRYLSNIIILLYYAHLRAKKRGVWRDIAIPLCILV